MLNVLEQEEQKALVTRCQMERITIISIENSLQFPINAVLDIVKPYVNLAAIDTIKNRLQKLMSMLTNKRYAQGMLKGCPDLFLPEFNLFIELKRRDGGVVSAEQIKVHDLLRSYGYKVEVCHGAKIAWETIEKERKK
jgi:hypothetical protein